MDITLKLLDAGANIASIVTALVAVVAFYRFTSSRSRRVARIESFLRQQSEKGLSVTILAEISRQLCIPESEIMDASFKSQHMDVVYLPHMQGPGPKIGFRYVEPAKGQRKGRTI